jgi:hypothetical protein
MNLAGRNDITAQCLDQRRQQYTTGTHPASRRGRIEVHTLAGVNGRLAVERLVISELAHSDVG